MVTLKELQNKIAIERKKLLVKEGITRELKAKRKAQADLILLKHRKAIAIGKKAKAISGKFGRALLRTGTKVGKKVGPAIIKQARLIREQQLRDDARERAILKQNPKTKKRSKKSKRKSQRKTNNNVFDLDF